MENNIEMFVKKELVSVDDVWDFVHYLNDKQVAALMSALQGQKKIK
jgi:hypothetical protein